MSHSIPNNQDLMRAYAERILKAINDLGNNSILPQAKSAHLLDRLNYANLENDANIKFTNLSQAATLKSNLAHGTHPGQSVKEKGSLKNAINTIYLFLQNEFEGKDMLMREYGLNIQHPNSDDGDEESGTPPSDSTMPGSGIGVNPTNPADGEDGVGKTDPNSNDAPE